MASAADRERFIKNLSAFGKEAGKMLVVFRRPLPPEENPDAQWAVFMLLLILSAAKVHQLKKEAAAIKEAAKSQDNFDDCACTRCGSDDPQCICWAR